MMAVRSLRISSKWQRPRSTIEPRPVVKAERMPARPKNDAAGGEIRSRNDLHQLFDGDLGVDR